EMAYASSNGDNYGSLECLGAPQGCLPGYSGPVFLGPELASGRDKNGYRRTFHAGEAVGRGSFKSFAYTAVPVTPKTTGVRGFCGDSSGVVCFSFEGAPAVEGGACARGCAPIR